jgi:hypothetical protein
MGLRRCGEREGGKRTGDQKLFHVKTLPGQGRA